ncbi:MAG TPA: class I SAM-dependent methyltransferase [Candidatus Paceibacterota bacterium]
MLWSREYHTAGGFATERSERWSNGKEEFSLAVHYGKNTDLFGLKQGTLQGFKDQVNRYRDLCRRFLGNTSNLEAVEKCALCGSSSASAAADVVIHGATYFRCPKCDLRYLKQRLSEAALDEFYATDKVLSATLTNKKLTKKRVEEIVMPKARWVLEQFERAYGRKPKKVVDVGAGGGHFVYAMKKLGIEAEGIEPNEPSVKYAQEAFGINLVPADFLEYAKKERGADLITFWALLEHLPDYMAFLHAAKNIFSASHRGMIIAEVPRWHSLGTIVQKTFPDSVNRHLFPLTHIRIFSDSSLATSFLNSGFAPAGAWFFGMDMYELVLQLSRAVDNERLVSETGKLLLGIQPIIDQGMLSDTMVFAGTLEK